MPYTLAYNDRFLRVAESAIESDTSDSIAFASIPDNVPTKLVAEWTGKQYTKILSALITGAKLMFPEEANEIIWQLIKVVHQPITLEDEEGDCINYPPSVPFISYEPQNPYNQPDLVPDGYLIAPFMHNADLEYPELLGYQATDVMVQVGALPVFSDWGDVLGLHFPTIKIRVNGQGQIELDLLSVALGGYAIIKVGSPPNILDLIDGIIETGVIVVDLSQDITSIPPESDIVISEEINIDVSEPTDVYIVFVPKLDISTEFFGFGGGIRQIGLCGFEGVAEMFVEDIRVNTEDYDQPTLEKRINGVWSIVENWPDVLSLIGDAYSLAVSAFEQGVLALEENDDQDLAIAALDERVDYLELEMENQIVRIDYLETYTDEIDERVDVLEAWKPTVDARLDALEAWDASEAVWSEEFDFTTGQHGWTGTFYQAGEGFLYSVGNTQNTMAGVVIYDNRVSFIEAHFKKSTGTGFVMATVQWPNGFNTQSIRLPQNVNDTSIQWIQANPINGQYSPDLEIIFAGAHSYYLTKIVIWGRGVNPF